MENSMDISQKLKVEVSYDPEIPLLGIYPGNTKILLWKYTPPTHPNVHSSTVYSDQDMEVTQMSINWWMDKDDMGCVCVWSKVKWVSQSCPTHFKPMDYSPLQVPLSVGILQASIRDWVPYWNGLPYTSPGNLPNPGIKPWSPTLQEDFLSTGPLGSPRILEWVACPLSDPEMELGSLTLQADSLPTELPEKPIFSFIYKREKNVTICNNVHGPREYYV